jgi:hypothetical protein
VSVVVSLSLLPRLATSPLHIHSLHTDGGGIASGEGEGERERKDRVPMGAAVHRVPPLDLVVREGGGGREGGEGSGRERKGEGEKWTERDTPA